MNEQDFGSGRVAPFLGGYGQSVGVFTLIGLYLGSSVRAGDVMATNNMAAVITVKRRPDDANGFHEYPPSPGFKCCDVKANMCRAAAPLI